MKKTIAFLLACLLVLSLSACGTSKPAATDTPAATDEPAAGTEDAAAADPATDSTTDPAATTDPATDAAPAADSEAQGTEDADQTTTTDDASTIQEYSTMDEINTATRGRIVRPANVEITNEAFQTVTSGNTTIGQYVFVAGGINCGVRFSSDFTLAISEIPDDEGNILFAGTTGDATATFSDGQAARWETTDGQYVLMVQSTDEEFFNGLLEEMKAASVPAES